MLNNIIHASRNQDVELMPFESDAFSTFDRLVDLAGQLGEDAGLFNVDVHGVCN
jgi:hypothetical protein